jgi:hypothetical protein
VSYTQEILLQKEDDQWEADKENLKLTAVTADAGHGFMSVFVMGRLCDDGRTRVQTHDVYRALNTEPQKGGYLRIIS